MQIITTRAELQAWSDAERAAGRRVGLVPTMGALHAGHLSLVEAARANADHVVVSIFVNPTQFNDPKDFEGYPRVMEDDLAACREAGVDVVWTPQAEELYPDGAPVWVDVEGISEPLCGQNRPGHFRGVTTVVTKLFLATRPHVAVFGQKDWQQLAVIRRMARDLDLVRPHVDAIHGVPTVREKDGLAMSSRNAYLSGEEREQAAALQRARQAAIAGMKQGGDPLKVLAGLREALLDSGFSEVDYAELRDAETLEPLSRIGPRPARLLVAARIGPARLIDNMAV